MKLNTIIVDDENANIEILKDILIEYANDEITIVGTSNNAKDAVDLINTLKPQVLFLDIQLDQGTCFDVLSKIDTYNYLPVFVSAYDNYILDSFKFNAINFILKPISIDDVMTSVDLILKQYELRNFTNTDIVEKLVKSIKTTNSNSTENILVISEMDSTSFIKLEDINYCKSDGRYTEFYLRSGQVETSCKNLGKYEEELPEKIFFRTHKSYLVNINSIRKIIKKNGHYCVLEDGSEIPISVRKSKSLHDRLL